MAYDYVFKTVLIGDSFSGKTCVFRRFFAEDAYSEEHLHTAGVDCNVKTLSLDPWVVKLQVFDTMGFERYRTIRSSYYRGVHGVFVVYDIADRESFNSLQNWIAEFSEHGPEKAVMFILGNKC